MFIAFHFQSWMNVNWTFDGACTKSVSTPIKIFNHCMNLFGEVWKLWRLEEEMRLGKYCTTSSLGNNAYTIANSFSFFTCQCQAHRN